MYENLASSRTVQSAVHVGLFPKMENCQTHVLWAVRGFEIPGSNADFVIQEFQRWPGCSVFQIILMQQRHIHRQAEKHSCG